MIACLARRAAVLTIAVLVTACSGLSATPNATPSAGPSITAGPSLPPSPLAGVVTSVDSAGLGKVNGFDLRLSDGTIVTLKVGVLENPTQFSPSHLAAHQATSVPIRAFYRLVGGIPVVYRLEDAPSG